MYRSGGPRSLEIGGGSRVVQGLAAASPSGL
ncbi:MAG: hypothetical protein Ct9H300mP27_05400 [Chloroflexota bacterium]|nr:MAG: hypothetical protein Ct9H300mP27_05400 [Chloroflexota bacterium]